MKRYDTPPKTKGSLEQRLRNVVEDDALQLRTRRQIGYMAVIAALAAHARDKQGQPLFAIKGGVAVELLVGLKARATKDLDAAVRAPADEIEPRLRDALAEGWDGFGFRLASWEPIRGTGAHRGDIKLLFRVNRLPPSCLRLHRPRGRPGRSSSSSTTPSSIPGISASSEWARCRS